VGCVETYWKNSGAVVWWCDNGLAFECNEWLKIATFPGYTEPLGLEITRGCKGGQQLTRGDIRSVQRQVFNNKERLDFRYYERHTVAHNLSSLFEGITIAKVKDPSNLGPFVPFSYDSEGGLSAMFYFSEYESNRGDVIIDCGFTKLFTELTEDGTLRYVQNIAAVTAQYEIHFRRMSSENGPKEFRPTSFHWPIDDRFPIDHLFDVVYLCDATGSMQKYISAAKSQCFRISDQLERDLPEFRFQFGAVFYRDPIDSPSDKHEVFPLSNLPERLESQIATIQASGGGDGPEDWVGAYRLVLDEISWRGGQQLIIHLADAPPHRERYYGTPNHESESPRLAPLIKQCAARGIKIVAMPIQGKWTENSFIRCQADYVMANGPLYEIHPFGKGEDIPNLFKSNVIAAVICAAPKSA
jgi:hypothetical protein